MDVFEHHEKVVETIEAILFKRSKGNIQYLLLKRIPEIEMFWQPITGKIEEGENKMEALKREIKEETGIENFIRIIEDVHYFEFSVPYLVKEYVYGVEVSPNETVILNEKEHSKFKWCIFKNALKLLKWKGNKEALKKLNKSLSAR